MEISWLLTKNLKATITYQPTVSLKLIYDLGLKFLLYLNRKFFDFKKTSFRYYGFLVAMFSCEVVGKGVCISQGWVQAEITTTI